MEVSAELDRDALVALLDRMLRAEARADAPPETERGEWTYGSVGYTEPDEHGWMAPILPKVWMPTGLVVWRIWIWSGGTIRREQMDDPRHSLARWPAIEREVQTYMAASPWLITDGPDAA
ncbi:hypothetical protein [Sphingobium sp. Ndbn-10]|uniref:hypothetical protein n=1 Tax=Sphingobium sp. Ndbn-10 TaxID=1667223 RepID=UPI000818823C|nr:hypothetical protein [Sphingobium sp. Ndbn-10]